MSSVVISGDTSGSVTLQAPAVAGTTVLTLPATSGTVIVGTAGVTSVASGGTGANTLTANNVILGNGTSAVQFVAPGTNGNLLTSNGTTWTSAAAPSSTPTTAQVLTATAGATAGAVGTYSWLGNNTQNSGLTNNTNYAGSGLSFAGVNANGFGPGTTVTGGGAAGGTASGTWKCMGHGGAAVNYNSMTVFLRVA
jgi:hypothetical protein